MTNGKNLNEFLSQCEWSQMPTPLERGFSPFEIKGQDELDKILWFYATATKEEFAEDKGGKALNYLVFRRGW